jgi:signal transduction histidine kinase/FixJ family two-component response regulator
LSTITILVVDDDVLALDFLASRLSAEGWSTRKAKSGEEALNILQAEPIDILVSDFLMNPGIDGSVLVDRAVAFKPDLYSIIFTSYYDNRQNAIKSLEAGVAAFLEKTSQLPDQLTAAVRRGIQTITLTGIGRQLLELNREEDILDLIVESLARVKDFDGCCLAVRGRQQICRVERAVDFRTGAELDHHDIEKVDSAYRYVIETERAYFPPFFVPAERTLLPFVSDSKSIAVVPLVLKAGEKGALGIEHRDANRLGIEDLRFLNQIASWVSLAMARLTQRERVRIEEERAREGRDLLARMVLHEIKNPLNNLATAVQVAVEGLPPETRKTLLDNVGRINQALNDRIRPLIRGENSPPETIEIARVIQEAVSRFRHYHPAGATSLLEQVSPALPTIVGNRAMLVSALVNLLENGATATESTGRPSEIRVTADYVKARDQVEVVVNDNGRGIPAHLIERVFDYGVTTGDGNEHSGYGLAFTKDVVSLSGGQISVGSKEGHGTTFKISFPAGRSPRASVQREVE